MHTSKKVYGVMIKKSEIKSNANRLESSADS